MMKEKHETSIPYGIETVTQSVSLTTGALCERNVPKKRSTIYVIQSFLFNKTFCRLLTPESFVK